MSSPRLFAGQFAGSPLLPDAEVTIRNLTQDFCMAFNTGNYDQAAMMFTPDGVLMAGHQEGVLGNKPIERRLAEMAENGYQDLRLETTRVESAGDMVMELGRYQLAIRRPDGTITMDRGKYLATWRRLGVWRLMATCWSSNLPVAG